MGLRVCGCAGVRVCGVGGSARRAGQRTGMQEMGERTYGLGYRLGYRRGMRTSAESVRGF